MAENPKEDEMRDIDLTATGHLEESKLVKFLKHRKFRKIRIQAVITPQYLDTVIKHMGSNRIVEIFDENPTVVPQDRLVKGEYLQQTCYVESNEHYSTSLDLRCTALKGESIKFFTRNKIKQLILRDYEDCQLTSDDFGTLVHLDELIITCGTPGDKKLTNDIGASANVNFLSHSFMDVIMETSRNPAKDLYQYEKHCTVSLAHLGNLKKFILKADRKRIVLRDIEQLTRLEELFIQDNPICDCPVLSSHMNRLRKLAIFNCGLQKLPNELHELESLEVLEFYSNPLSTDPVYIPPLSNLQKLHISSCHLQSVPLGIQLCINLKILDLSDNPGLGKDLITIPKLEKLNFLFLRNCGLHVIPNGLYDLPNLVNLALDFNQLTELPEQLNILLQRNVSISLGRNAMEHPQQSRCPSRTYIHEYFDDIHEHRKMTSKRMRLTVIGNACSGRTSLVSALLTNAVEVSSIREEGSGTVEIQKWHPDPRNSGLQLDVWNIKADDEFQCVNNLFLRDDSLFLLVVELLTYKLTDESFDENVGKWISMLKRRVRRPVVMLAITKSLAVDRVNRTYRDYCDELDGEKCRHLNKKIAKLGTNDDEASLTEGIANMKESQCHSNARISKPVKLRCNKFRPPTSDNRGSHPVIILVSERIPITIAQSGENVSLNKFQKEWILKVKEQICQTANNTSLFPYLNSPLSAYQLEIEELILQLKIKENGPRFLTVTEIDQWLSNHSKKFKNDPEKVNTLQRVLRDLVRLGRVLKFEDVRELKDFVFFDLNWLSTLVKNVVRRDMSSWLQYNKEFTAYNIDLISFNLDKMNLCEKGLLSESLLRCIWHDMVPINLHFHQIVPLLEYLDVGYTLAKREESEGKVVRKKYILVHPFIPDAPCTEVNQIWPTGSLADVLETKSVYQFSRRVPNGLFERFISRSSDCLDHTLLWKTGIIGVSNFDSGGKAKFLITVPHKNEDTIEFTTRVKPSVQLKTMWFAILCLHHKFANLINDSWPELRYAIYNECPNCRHCHFRMDIEEVMSLAGAQVDELSCRNGDRKSTVIVKSELVYPPPAAIQDLQKVLPGWSRSGNRILDVTEDFTKVRRSTAVSGDDLIEREILVHRRQQQKPKTLEVPCKSLMVFNARNIPRGMVRFIHDELGKPNLDIVLVTKYLTQRNILVLHIERPAMGIVVIQEEETVVRVTFTNVFHVATVRPEESTRPHPCQCNEIFQILDKILHSGRSDFYTLISCEGESFLMLGNEKKPVNADLIVQVETLAMELRRHEEAMNDLVWRNCMSEKNDLEAGSAVPAINQADQILMRDLVEIRSKYFAVLRRLRVVYSELQVKSNIWQTRNESDRSTASNSELQPFGEDATQRQRPLNSGSDQSSENLQNNGGGEKFVQRFSNSDGSYTLSRLLQVFTDKLLTDDWVRLRHAISNHISSTVLPGHQNGVGIFNELVRCNYIGDGNLDLLRELFYEIERVDFVHLIDCIEEGDYRLLDQEGEQQRHQMDVAAGIDNSMRVTKAQETHGLTVPANALGDSPRSKTTKDVKSVAKPLARSKLDDQVVVRQTEDDTELPDPGLEDNYKFRRKNKNSSPMSQTISFPKQEMSFSENESDPDSVAVNIQNQQGAFRASFNERKDAGNRVSSRACQPEKQACSHSRSSRSKGNHGGSSPEESRPQEGQRGRRDAALNERLEVSCEHYDRYCDVQFGCCEQFWPCHRCHNSQSKCGQEKLRSRDIKKIKCKRCRSVQEFPKELPHCVECGLKFAEYFCPICQHLTGKQNYPYHCERCGICRVHEDRSFHCDVCGICLDIHLLENHICRAGSAHDECCICFEDAFTGCQILPCSHKVHKDCATLMLQNGITNCPICRQSFAHLVEHRIVRR